MLANYLPWSKVRTPLLLTDCTSLMNESKFSHFREVGTGRGLSKMGAALKFSRALCSQLSTTPFLEILDPPLLYCKNKGGWRPPFCLPQHTEWAIGVIVGTNWWPWLCPPLFYSICLCLLFMYVHTYTLAIIIGMHPVYKVSIEMPLHVDNRQD